MSVASKCRCPALLNEAFFFSGKLCIHFYDKEMNFFLRKKFSLSLFAHKLGNSRFVFLAELDSQSSNRHHVFSSLPRSRRILGLFGMRALRAAFLLVIIVMMMIVMLMMIMVFSMLHQSVSFRLILMTDEEVQGAFRRSGRLLACRWWNRCRDR